MCRGVEGREVLVLGYWINVDNLWSISTIYNLLTENLHKQNILITCGVYLDVRNYLLDVPVFWILLWFPMYSFKQIWFSSYLYLLNIKGLLVISNYAFFNTNKMTVVYKIYELWMVANLALNIVCLARVHNKKTKMEFKDYCYIICISLF